MDKLFFNIVFVKILLFFSVLKICMFYLECIDFVLKEIYILSLKFLLFEK